MRCSLVKVSSHDDSLQDVVKDIMAFADTGSGDETLPDLPPEPETLGNGAGFSEAQSPCSSDADESCYEDEGR